MNFLVVYGTTEGQTAKIASFVASKLEELDHKVDLKDSKRRLPDLDISTYDGIVLAGSVHQKKHQTSIANFLIAHRDQINKLPNLLLSISLSVAFEDGQEEAQVYVDSFIDYTGFTPAEVLLVAGALRFDEYDFFMEQIVEFVVLKDHEKISEDKEFTDWKQLDSDIETFANSVENGPWK